MSYEPPSPPANLPTEIVDAPQRSHIRHLRDAASVRRWPELWEREARLEEEADDADIEERPDDLPRRRAGEATITIKGDQRQPLLLLAVAGRSQ